MMGKQHTALLIVFLSFLCCIYETVGGIIFVGTEVNTLYVCNYNEATGAITLRSSTNAINPSFIALHPSEDYIYIVNEVDSFNNTQNTGGISSYRIDRVTGDVKLINSVYSNGGSPAHIELDRTRRFIGVANYNGGNYGVWSINADFSIASKPGSFFQDTGKGPLPQQDGPHAHEFVFDPTNKFVVVPDLGNDSWNQYTFDASSGKLTAASTPVIKAPAGSGPRHFAFHPFLPYAYGVSELASTVTVFTAIAPLTTLAPIQTISTLPSTQPSAAAELQFSHDGATLYVSNRLTNINGTIAIFKIDRTTGKLTNVGYSGTQGVQPRFFNLSKDGRFVLVANQFSNNIKVFARDEQTGLIGALVSSLNNINQPSHILQL